MLLQTKNLFVVLLTIGVILSGFMIVFVNVQPPTLTTNNHGFDGFMTDVAAIKMDAAGFPRSKLFSPTFHYYRTRNTIIVEKPVMIITPNNSHPGGWTITANQATAFLTNKMIHLYGNVHITRNQNKNLPRTKFITSALIIDTNQDKAFTREKVTIIQPNNNLTAKGLRANLKTGVISLMSNASGEFNPDAN